MAKRPRYNQSKKPTKNQPITWSQRFGIWVGIIAGLVGITIGILTYVNAQRNTALSRIIEAQQSLAEAADILGGKLGSTTSIYVEEDRNRLELARRKIDKALIFDPKNPDSLKLKGTYLQHVGELEEAIKFYKKATEIDATYASAHNNMGTALHTLGKINDAVVSYRKAIALNPKEASVYYNLGNALKDLGDLEKSVHAYRKAIELNPKHAAAYSNMGTVLRNLGKPEEAIESHRKSVRIDPKQELS